MTQREQRPAAASPERAVVLVTGGPLAPEAAALLDEHALTLHYAPPFTHSTDLAQTVADLQADGIIVRTGPVTADVIVASARLRVIAKHGTGVDNIDLAAASAHGIPVLRALAANAQAVAEHTLALVLALRKDLIPLDRATRSGDWRKSGHRSQDIAGAALGLIGYGAIGQRVAVLAHSFGMQVLVYDPHLPPGPDETGVSRVEQLDDLLAAADVVSLHCPLTPATRHLIGAEQLRQMKPTAFLVNTARGGLVDEAALLDALRRGAIAGAGLDTFETEPPAANHPLWTLPNLIATPHIAGVSPSAVRTMGLQAARHVIDVLSGSNVDQRSVANPDYVAGRRASLAERSPERAPNE